ncbi:MAG TPA: DivIVA domain-containing protein [Streptosporangiaceae bacterium]|nr:DivIVA domain-containing protein [Streptosporangiaceae bacterium]
MSQADSRDRQGLLDLISQVQFGETRVRPGYVKQDVDQFLLEVRATLAGARQPPLSPADVRAAQFRTTRLHRGYDEEQVDAFLDRIEQGLRQAG